MNTNIGLNDDARFEVGQILNLLLADESLLYATTRDYHWNVTGPEFEGLHRQFDEQGEQIAKWIDDVAERARAIGVSARGSFKELAASTRMTADPGFDLAAEHMLLELLALHEDIAQQLRKDAKACSDSYGDIGTSDFLVTLMARHERSAWMLRAQLETEETPSS